MLKIIEGEKYKGLSLGYTRNGLHLTRFYVGWSKTRRTYKPVNYIRGYGLYVYRLLIVW